MTAAQFNELNRQADVIEQNTQRIKDLNIWMLIDNSELEILEKEAQKSGRMIRYITEPAYNDYFIKVYFDIDFKNEPFKLLHFVNYLGKIVTLKQYKITV